MRTTLYMEDSRLLLLSVDGKAYMKSAVKWDASTIEYYLSNEAIEIEDELRASLDGFVKATKAEDRFACILGCTGLDCKFLFTCANCKKIYHGNIGHKFFSKEQVKQSKKTGERVCKSCQNN